MRQISTSTLTNQNISSGILCYTYTADADREIFFRLFADQIAGNGSYTAYTTIRLLGAGSEYEIQPRTTATVVSGILSIGFTTIPIPVKNTDVIKVYIDGIASDLTTPDIITEVWEADYSRPTIQGQHDVDITSAGTVGIDWNNIESPSTTVNLSNTTIKNVNDLTSPPTANQIADQVWDEVLAGHLTAGTTGEALDNAGGGNAVTAENVWAYPSRTITGADVSGATLSEALEGTTLNIRRGDSTSITFTGLGVLTGYTSLWFTIKPDINRTDADADSIIQIKKNASGSGDGLLYFNSDAAPDASLGSIVVDDAAAGIITIAIDKTVTAQLAPVKNKPYDIQMLLSSGISTLTDGKANIYGDVTRALS